MAAVQYIEARVQLVVLASTSSERLGSVMPLRITAMNGAYVACHAKTMHM